MNIKIKNSGRIIACNDGDTILSSLRSAGESSVPAPCSGLGICNKCKVYLISGEVTGAALDGAGRVNACRAKPISDIEIELPDITMSSNEIKRIERKNSRIPRAAVALDIGTTTVSAYLLDRDTGNTADSVSILNPQGVFGADVMSRIKASGDGGYLRQTQLIRDAFRGIVNDFKSRNEIGRIEKAAVGGNTTMMHLFAGEDPTPMGAAPFTPVFTDMRVIRDPAEFGGIGEMTLLPGISAFVGSDVVSGIGAAGAISCAGASLYIDIGTNGEIAVINNGKILTSSTAAGPCLEGAGISCGSGAVPGAVNKVFIKSDGSIGYTVLGELEAQSICGCGLIDAVSVMLKKSIIDETGAFTADGDFMITDKVCLKQKDVRQFQLAKSAICSGLKVLVKSAGLTLGDIERVYVAGGIGFFIDPQSAAATGLIPKELVPKLHICGNLSLTGAAKFLVGDVTAADLNKIVSSSGSVELANNPDFTDEFMDNMMFDI